MKKTVAQIIFDTLADLGVEDCFCVVGGGAMHLDHALGTNDCISTHFVHHEQSCTMAAEAYARFKGVPAAVCVTSGPGATNALTGVMGAWVDSVPMIVISGNVRYEISVEASGLPLRYRGIQEFNIINSVQNMTKYAAVLKDPLAARAQIVSAFDIAMDGRRGPVWIDVPLDIQNALVDTTDLMADFIIDVSPSPKADADSIAFVAEKLRRAKRPCVLFGSAIATSSLCEPFQAFISELGIPVVGGAWIGDVLPRENELYFGSSGNIGPRVGNFILENADVILVLGNSLSFKQTGYKLDVFAPHAEIIMVDADENERIKLGEKVDYFLHCNLESFFCLAHPADWDVKVSCEWLSHCNALKDRFSVYEGAEGVDSTDRVNKYHFWKIYDEIAPRDGLLVLGNSQVGLSANQIGKRAARQRIIANCICGSMGYDLPAAIGVATASKRPVVCVTGDGSMMMNLQELETIAYQELPIKIFVFENGGYGGIRQSQGNFFGDFDFGSGPQSGVGIPNFVRIGEAFYIPSIVCESNADVERCLRWALGIQGPALVEVKEVLDDPVVPKLISRPAEDGTITEPLLCDLSPFVDEETLEWALSPVRQSI